MRPLAPGRSSADEIELPFPEEQNSWWRLSLHQESIKALGGDLAYTKSPPRLLVENEPTPRVHQELSSALGGLLVDFLAESWCPPRK